MNTKNQWARPALILLCLTLLVVFVPNDPIDPWKLISLKKIASLIFALTLVQVLGAILISRMGTRVGSILTGFFGGLISSTATTATVARRSHSNPNPKSSRELLSFLAATLAMLFEAIGILTWGTDEFHHSLLFVFLGPVIVTAVIIFKLSLQPRTAISHEEKVTIEIWSSVKLAAFIISTLVLSKAFEKLFGQSGILVLTFIVSLFEIHGSIIANIQLHDANVFNLNSLGTLIAISIAASYCSKIFLVSSLGSKDFRKRANRYSLIILSSLFLSWILFGVFV